MNIPATWRGEPVRIVSQRGAKLQIARAGSGLRWVAAATVALQANTPQAACSTGENGTTCQQELR